jgi:hypothetical protein
VSCSLSRDPFPTSCTYLFHPLHCRHHHYLRKSSWYICVCHFRPPRFPIYVPPAAQVRLACCSPQVTRSAMMRFTFLFCMPLPPLSLLPVLQLPCLQTVMMKFPFHVSHTVLLWFRAMGMLRLLSAPRSFLPPPPPLLLFALNLPCRLAATADALSGMDLRLLLLLLLCRCADHACHLMHDLIALSLADQDCWFLLTGRLQTEWHICLGAPSGRSGGGCAGGRQQSSFLVCLCAHMRICFDNSRP